MSRFAIARSFRLALIGALAAALALAGCGRKGPLDPPPGASIDRRGAAEHARPDEQRTGKEPEAGKSKAPQGARQADPPRRHCSTERVDAPLRLSRRRLCTPRRSASTRSPQQVGTPFYCYSTATLERHYQVFAGAFADVDALVCYAMKANSNQAVIATLAKLGAGADVVSEGELKRARAAGIPADKIMFSGIGKTARELALAVDEGILCINVESEPELESAVADRVGEGRDRAVSRCASIPTSTPRPTPRSPPARPRTSSAFRSAARARSMRTRPSCRASRSPASTCISAARSPICDPFDDAFALLADFVRTLRADGHTHLACRSRRRPRHSLSRRQRAAAASGRLCRGGQARHARSRLPADLRAGPADRRQCRHPGDARACS